MSGPHDFEELDGLDPDDPIDRAIREGFRAGERLHLERIRREQGDVAAARERAEIAAREAQLRDEGRQPWQETRDEEARTRQAEEARAALGRKEEIARLRAIEMHLRARGVSEDLIKIRMLTEIGNTGSVADEVNTRTKEAEGRHRAREQDDRGRDRGFGPERDR